MSQLTNLVDLTGNDFTSLNNTHCDLTGSPDKHFRRVTTKIANSSYEGGYDNATRSIYQVLTVHMLVANADRKREFYDSTNSSLQCVRVRQFNDISRQLDRMDPGSYGPSANGRGLGGRVRTKRLKLWCQRWNLSWRGCRSFAGYWCCCLAISEQTSPPCLETVTGYPRCRRT